MLTINVGSVELFNETTQTFEESEGTILQLEHSLVSLSKWESEFEIPFLDDKPKTSHQLLSYIKFMDLDPDRPLSFYAQLNSEDIKKIQEYMNRKMTATWFRENNQKKGGSGEAITSELIYYWMVALTIPFECQYWHLSRLLTLIQVANIKNQPAKKMSKAEVLARNRSLNAARQAKHGTTG